MRGHLLEWCVHSAPHCQHDEKSAPTDCRHNMLRCSSCCEIDAEVLYQELLRNPPRSFSYLDMFLVSSPFLMEMSAWMEQLQKMDVEHPEGEIRPQCGKATACWLRRIHFLRVILETRHLPTCGLPECFCCCTVPEWSDMRRFMTVPILMYILCCQEWVANWEIIRTSMLVEAQEKEKEKCK